MSCSEYSWPSIINSTVADNQALSGGGAHIGKYAEAVVSNSIIACNSSGITVEQAGHGVNVGDRVDISGVMRTNADEERYIDAAQQVIAKGLDKFESSATANINFFNLLLGLTHCAAPNKE